MNLCPRCNAPASRVVLALAVTLLLSVIVLAGCTAFWQPVPPVDPLAEYRPALRDGFSLEPAILAAMPRYSITLKVDPATREFEGFENISIPVTGTVLHELYFRLYPNIEHFYGMMDVESATVNSTTVNFSYEAEETAVHLALPFKLQPGTTAEVAMSFSGKMPEHPSGFYTIFGLSEDIYSLSNFYPILAGRREGGWALDIAGSQGDVGFHAASLYHVTLLAPADQIVAATGTVVSRTLTADGIARTEYVQGPAREFTLVMSPRFQIDETEAYGTLVRSYSLPEDNEAARSALYDAAIALQVYSDQFGPYPYREMAVVEAPLTYHGMEFPGMSLIGSDVYEQHQEELENLVVHEVAHHWWYDQIGSDQVESPWLDEGLAEFSMYMYYLHRYGATDADWLRTSRWEAPVYVAEQNGFDAPIGLPASGYQGNYETIVYAKGALFFATLRDTIGAENLLALLRTYLDRYCWQIATPDEFRSLAEEVSGQSLDELWATWVGNTQ